MVRKHAGTFWFVLVGRKQRLPQAFLTKDLSHDDLTALLRTNDKLQEGLCSWEGLVSMDIVNSGHSDNDSHSSTDGTKWGLKARHIADSAIDQDHSPTDEMERLKVENEGLRQSLSDLEAAQQREMLKTDADYRSSLKDVKSKAASRIKDLLRQVENGHRSFETLHASRLSRSQTTS